MRRNITLLKDNLELTLYQEMDPGTKLISTSYHLLRKIQDMHREAGLATHLTTVTTRNKQRKVYVLKRLP